MDNTIRFQGYFSSDGTDKLIDVGTSVDWVRVYNLTNIASSTQWASTEFYWQRGMTDGDALNNFHAAASQVISSSTCAVGFNGATYYGITPIDTSVKSFGSIVASTGVTAASPPLVTTGSTAGLVANSSIVRLTTMLGTAQFSGMDFSVGAIVANTSFALAHAPQPIASVQAGEWRVVDYDAKYYPRRRYVTAVTAANPAVVTMSVTNDFTVGEKVRFVVPAAFGMIELDGLTATITAVDKVGTTGHNTITTDIDSSAFTAFAFPLTAAVPFTHAQVIPVGENTAIALAGGLDSLGGATYDTDYQGFKLATSSSAAIALGSAGGTSSDAIKWYAGKSFKYDI